MTNLFSDAYIERSDKETEEFLGEESVIFLNEPIQYFHDHLNEFLYVESPAFETISVDAISFEVDDVFRTYDVLLGLRKMKKFGPSIRSYFAEQMTTDDGYDLMFDAQEGIWNINFSLHTLPGFRADMTIKEAYELIFHFLDKLIQTLK